MAVRTVVPLIHQKSWRGDIVLWRAEGGGRGRIALSRFRWKALVAVAVVWLFYLCSMEHGSFRPGSCAQ